MKKKRLTAIDAFCGAGGISLGLKAADFDVQLGFDLDPLSIKTLSNNPKHISHAVLNCDVRTLLNGGLLDLTGIQVGSLDLLAGGPPCQGFSIQRTVGTDRDDRNLLVNDYGDLILQSMPKFFLLENVPGLGGKRGKEVLAAFILRMSESGYRVHMRILDAQDYGVPQRRRRLLLVGERRDHERSNFEWPLSIKKRSSVRETISHLPELNGDGLEHPNVPGHRADRLSDKNLQRIRSIVAGQGRTHLPEDLLANCHRRSADEVGHRNVYGRMSWDEVAPTITARFDSFTRGKFGHPEQDRSISLLEGALLQTFPQDYVFSGKKVDIARQIGNAMPVNFAAAVATSIAKALNE